MRLRNWMAGAALMGACGVAHGQTGVSDDRVSLPEGPGSLEGIGENISLDPNMGVMRYGVGIKVPRGFAGVTPDLRLAYSSGGGSGLVGVGWSMTIPHIERSTFKGLPEYTADDRFTADGGTQLVRLPGAGTPTYRARYEGGFVRYTWRDVGRGAEGYWQAEYPDGRVATFGATADGTLVPSARVSGPDGTFRYMVVDIVDVHGHRLQHSYTAIDGYALIRGIDYVFTDGEPQYSVSFNYEDRADETGEDILSDAKAGFDERLTQRLAAINVFSGENRIRRYDLTYERYADSGGFTRLSEIATLGVDGSTYPAVQRFGWSRSLEGICDAGDDCSRPFVVDMGNIGVNIGVGRATLIDINGDALPDIVDTSDDGAHQFLLNIPSVDGVARFSDTPIQSAVGLGSGFRLGTPFVQVLDVNGDGYADLLDARNGRALLNDGSGDWASLEDLADTATVGDALGADFDAGEGGLRTLRFIDIDNDKRIDMLRSTREGTRIFQNKGRDGFEVMPDVDVLGYDLAVDNIDLTDMNGDGLLDAVKLNVGGLRYRLNLGHGRWGDEVEVLGLPIDESELDLASLDDLNGDGLADLVVVVGRQVKFAINRNGTAFSQITTLNSGAVEGELPLRDATVTVAMADVNGNGSTDVVWLDAQGQVTALELFPVRPNQLSQISNGLGMVTDITYTTSVQEMARDGDWAHTLPHPMQVVAEVRRSDSATGVDQVTRYRYRDGFYDGEEKQFRGFAEVEIETLGDDSQETGLTINAYDLGVEDRYRHGRLLSSAVLSAERLINRSENDYADCPLDGVPQTEPAIRFVCMTGSTTTVAEGASEAEHVTIRDEMTYDGYGNVVLDAKLGVVAVGGGGCAPCADDVGGACGADCSGDEYFTETTFIEPGAATDGRWILGRIARERMSADLDDEATERRFFYDGPDFEGLPEGQLTLGRLTRVTDRVDSERFVETSRYRRDDHGNIVEIIDPLGAPGSATHRALFTMDADGLRVVRVEAPLEDADGQPYSLARTLTYESLFDRVASSSAWQILDANGQPRAADRVTQYAYDAFGRLESITRPGDAPGAPGSVYSYDLTDTVSRIITRSRTTANGPLTRESIACLDGRGRTLQNRTRVAEGRYQVTGLTVYNVNGESVRVYEPYISNSPECDIEAPEGVLFSATRRDATGRELTITEPDANEFGTASVYRNVYGPLTSTMFDAEDNDSDSPHADTPNHIERDGLGRVIRVERQLADGTVATTRNVFDVIGRIAAVVDADGNVKRQDHDLLSRVLRVQDPNKAGDFVFAYDDANNLISADDGRGEVVEYRYDGLNRQIARFAAADPDGTRETTLWDFDPDCDPAVCTNTAGQPVRETAPGLDDVPSVIRRGFDARDRPLRIEREIEGVPMAFAFEYDTLDQPTRITYPGGEVLDFRYDDAARLVGIDGFIDRLEYDERGLLATMAYANGTRTEITQDDRARLAERRVVAADGTVLQHMRFDRDRIGNVLNITDDASALPRGVTYEYDAWYRTVRSAGADGQVIANRYAINDNVVQRISEGDPVASLTGDFVYDGPAPNAVTRIGDTRFAYDDAGNTTTRGDQTLSWDALGRLRRVERDDTLLAEYAYGADHRRTVRREADSTTLYGARNWQLRDGISTLHVSVGNLRIARVESDDLAAVALSDIAPLDDADGRIDAGDAWIAQGAAAGLVALESERPASPVGALLESSLRRMFMEQTATAWLHHDHLDSIVMATDVNGAVIGERAFEQTGVERSDSVGYVDEYGFTGQAIDRATGLLHFEHRMFDPMTGRWMSADPLFTQLNATDALNPSEALNPYGYVSNNYANFIDPTGLNKTLAPGGDGNNQAKPKKTPKQLKKAQKAKKAKIKKAKKIVKRVIKKGKLGKNDDLSVLSGAQFDEIITSLDSQLETVNLAQTVAKKLTKASMSTKVRGGAEIAIGGVAVAAGVIEFFTPGGQLIGAMSIAGGTGAIALGIATLNSTPHIAKNFDLTNPVQAQTFLDTIAPKPAGELRTQLQNTRNTVANTPRPVVPQPLGRPGGAAGN